MQTLEEGASIQSQAAVRQARIGVVGIRFGREASEG